MLQKRIIPCLLLKDGALVKTVNFKKHIYIGDPLNTCRIFNELEVDELAILDIEASREGKRPNFKLLNELANECFMPLSYGGGIVDVEDAKRLFSIGYEKIIINSASYSNPNLIPKIVDIFGTQSVIASVDVKKGLFSKYYVYSKGGTYKEKVDLVSWLKKIEELGAGEILLTSIDNEGTWDGFDLRLIKTATDNLSIPVIAHGGAGCKEDVENVVKQGKASAVGLGSMVVFQKKGMGVLINYTNDYDF